MNHRIYGFMLLSAMSLSIAGLLVGCGHTRQAESQAPSDNSSPANNVESANISSPAPEPLNSEVTPASPPGERPAGPDEEHQEGGHHKHFTAEGAVITDHGLPMLEESQAIGSLSPEQRAAIVVDRLNTLIETHDFDDDAIFMRMINGYPCVFFYHNHGSGIEGHLLATVDPKTAGEFGYQDRAVLLAYWWRDILRDHALIIGGKTPHWTTRYAPTMQRLYQIMQEEQAGVPSHESFEQAMVRLSPDEKTALQHLYSSVPVGYAPQPNDVQAAEKAHDAAGPGDVHHD